MESKQTVLVIDDENGPRRALKAILEDYFNVATFEDGSSAIAFAKSKPEEVHAAFVDHAMPKMNGSEVCVQLKAINPTISLIGFSGNENADFECELFAFLTKKGANKEQVLKVARSAADLSTRLRQGAQ